MSIEKYTLTNLQHSAVYFCFQEWYNPKQTWSPPKYGKIESINISSEAILTPDIYSYGK